VRDHTKLYIDGVWREPLRRWVRRVGRPRTGEVSGRVVLGVRTMSIWRLPRPGGCSGPFSRTSSEERIELLERIADEYERRGEDMVRAVTAELGSPLSLSRAIHVAAGLIQFRAAAQVPKTFTFTEGWRHPYS
jgi:aldehyde dehydrogenase (NAD+)